LLSLTEARPQIKEDALEIAYVSLFQRDESYGAEERREVKAFSRGGIKEEIEVSTLDMCMSLG
jgi:hypothetical protein